MTVDKSRNRLHELETQFKSLEDQIQDEPVKTAVSVLHGMIQEPWRIINTSQSPGKPVDVTLHHIANMYKGAPRMEGQATHYPLPTGMLAPDFALPDSNGRTVKLSDFKGKPVLLVFYPLDWSPGCSQQLDLYQNELTEFERRGIQLIGISVDSIYSHGVWAAVRGLTFPLLADFNPKGAVAKQYHVFREQDGFSERALYLIDERGIIQYSHISPFVHHVPDIYELYNNLDKIDEMKTSLVQ